MIVPRTGLIACFGALAGVAALAPSKAQAQCAGGGYYEPAPRVVYSPPVYYSEPTYYAPRAPVVYHNSPRVYRSYSVGVNVGHGQYSRGNRDYGRDYGHRQAYRHQSRHGHR